MSATNAYELFSRNLKLGKLQAAAINVERQTGASKPESLSFWRNASEQEWASLCVLSGCRPASPVTRRLFLESMAVRAGVIE